MKCINFICNSLANAGSPGTNCWHSYYALTFATFCSESQCWLLQKVLTLGCYIVYADTYLVNCCQTMCYFPEDCIFSHCEIFQFYIIGRVDDVSSLPQSVTFSASSSLHQTIHRTLAKWPHIWQTIVSKVKPWMSLFVSASNNILNWK